MAGWIASRRDDIVSGIIVGVVLILVLTPAIRLWTNHLPLKESVFGIPSLDDPRLDDFAVFYSAGDLIRRGAGEEIYDLEAIRTGQEQLTGRIIDRQTVLPYLNPPFFAAALVPLTTLPFAAAAGIFTALSGLALAAALFVLSRLGKLSPLAGLVFVLAVLASVPVHDTFLHGQTSFFLLLSWADGLLLLTRGRKFEAGLALGLLLLKPQLALLPVAFFLMRRDWSLLRGFAASGLSTLVVSVLVSGPGILGSYFHRLLEAGQWDERNGISTWGMFGWNAFVRATVGPGEEALSLTATIALCALTVFVCAWVLVPRFPVRSREFAAQYGVVAVASLLLSPHLYSQDLVIAVVPIFILLSVVGKPFDTPAWKSWALGASLLLFFHFSILARIGLNFTTLNLVVLLAALSFAVLLGVSTGRQSLEARDRSRMPAPTVV